MNHTSRGPVESVMKIKTVSLIIVTVTLLALQGCTTLSAPTGHTAAQTVIPVENPVLDHYIAWIPRELAQTASVAEAMAHISLVNAREQTASQLCAGRWMMQGKVAENIGPLPAMAAAGPSLSAACRRLAGVRSFSFLPVCGSEAIVASRLDARECVLT